MEDIKELIKIVTDHTKKNVPLLDLRAQHENGNKELNLFLGIKNGVFNDENEASQGIYGSQEIDFKFRMLKSRLNRKLLNHLFFMDFSSGTEAKSANLYQETLDYLHFSKMLLNIEETKIGTKMLNKTLDLAKTCEYTTIVIDCLKSLRELYARTYRPKLFQSIKAELEEYEALQKLEDAADSIFQEHQLSINSSVNNRKKSLKPYEDAIEGLQGLYKQSRSFNIFEQYVKMKIWYLELKGDFKSVLMFIDQVEKEVIKGKINQRRFDTLFIQLAKGNALLKLQLFAKGTAFMEKMLKETESSSKTWYVFAEKLIMLHIRNRQFNKASEIFLKVASNKSSSQLETKDMLRWNIYRSYLYYLTENKKIIRKFDYHKFIEETPEYRKEYAGLNVSILILQLLWHADGDLALLYDKLNALDEYVNKYLNNSYSKRTKTFCKLLRKMVAHNRDYNVIYPKSKYLLEKLNDYDIVGESYIDFEVVPYEFLWTHLMKVIKNPKRTAMRK